MHIASDLQQQQFSNPNFSKVTQALITGATKHNQPKIHKEALVVFWDAVLVDYSIVMYRQNSGRRLTDNLIDNIKLLLPV